MQFLVSRRIWSINENFYPRKFHTFILMFNFGETNDDGRAIGFYKHTWLMAERLRNYSSLNIGLNFIENIFIRRSWNKMLLFLIIACDYKYMKQLLTTKKIEDIMHDCHVNYELHFKPLIIILDISYSIFIPNINVEVILVSSFINSTSIFSRFILKYWSSLRKIPFRGLLELWNPIQVWLAWTWRKSADRILERSDRANVWRSSVNRINNSAI